MANTSPQITLTEAQQRAYAEKQLSIIEKQAKKGSDVFNKIYLKMMNNALGRFIVKSFKHISENTKTYFSKIGSALGGEFKKMFGRITEAFAPVLEVMKATANFMWRMIIKPLGLFVSGFALKGIGLLFKAPAYILKSITGWVWDTVSSLTSQAFNFLKKAGKWVLSLPFKFIKWIVKGLGEVIWWAFKTQIEAVGKAITLAKAFISKIVSTIGSVVVGIFQTIGKGISMAGNFASGVLQMFLPGFLSWIGPVVGFALKTILIGLLFKGVAGVAGSIFSSITSGLGTMFEFIWEKISGWAKSFWGWMHKEMPETAKWLEKWYNKMTEKLPAMLKSLVDISTQLFTGMLPFIKGVGEILVDSFQTMMTQLPGLIVDGFTKWLTNQRTDDEESKHRSDDATNERKKYARIYNVVDSIIPRDWQFNKDMFEKYQYLIRADENEQKTAGVQKTFSTKIGNLADKTFPAMVKAIEGLTKVFTDASTSSSNFDLNRGSNNTTVTDANVKDIMSKVAKNESGGQKNPYAAVGEKTRSGHKARGKYQIMEHLWPSYAKAAGMEGAKRTPENEEKVTFITMKGLLAKYKNPNLVASAWFTGEQATDDMLSGKISKTDFLKRNDTKTTVAGYLAKINGLKVSIDEGTVAQQESNKLEKEKQKKESPIKQLIDSMMGKIGDVYEEMSNADIYTFGRRSPHKVADASRDLSLAQNIPNNASSNNGVTNGGGANVDARTINYMNNNEGGGSDMYNKLAREPWFIISRGGAYA